MIPAAPPKPADQKPKPIVPPIAIVKKVESEDVVRSLGSKMDRLIEEISKSVSSKQEKPTTVKVILAQQESKGEKTKSYADKSYQEVSMSDDGKVSHPYDVDCPYCHNMKETDMVAHRDKMRTEQSMKYDRE